MSESKASARARATKCLRPSGAPGSAAPRSHEAQVGRYVWPSVECALFVSCLTELAYQDMKAAKAKDKARQVFVNSVHTEHVHCDREPQPLISTHTPISSQFTASGYSRQLTNSTQNVRSGGRVSVELRVWQQYGRQGSRDEEARQNQRQVCRTIGRF